MSTQVLWPLSSWCLPACGFFEGSTRQNNPSMIWGFPKIRGIFLGVPIIEIIVYWVYIGVLPI